MEQKQENKEDVISLTPHTSHMLDWELRKWGHLSFRWDVQLQKGDHFEGPKGTIYKITSDKGDISKVSRSSVSKELIKDVIETRDTFWCDDVLMYASVTSGIINLQTREFQDDILFKIRKLHHEKDAQKQQQNNPKPTIRLGQRKSINDIKSFLIFDDYDD